MSSSRFNNAFYTSYNIHLYSLLWKVDNFSSNLENIWFRPLDLIHLPSLLNEISFIIWKKCQYTQFRLFSLVLTSSSVILNTILNYMMRKMSLKSFTKIKWFWQVLIYCINIVIIIVLIMNNDTSLLQFRRRFIPETSSVRIILITRSLHQIFIRFIFFNCKVNWIFLNEFCKSR